MVTQISSFSRRILALALLLGLIVASGSFFATPVSALSITHQKAPQACSFSYRGYNYDSYMQIDLYNENCSGEYYGVVAYVYSDASYSIIYGHETGYNQNGAAIVHN